jgi:hypothetical protein
MGDAIHALLCRAGHNRRLILRHLGRLLRTLLRRLFRSILAGQTPSSWRKATSYSRA